MLGKLLVEGTGELQGGRDRAAISAGLVRAVLPLAISTQWGFSMEKLFTSSVHNTSVTKCT